MKRRGQLFLFAVFSTVFIACNNEKSAESVEVIEPAVEFEAPSKETFASDDIQIESYDFEAFKPFLNQKDGKIHVINFWATWCVPCVAELPYFDAITTNHPEIDVTLVSLDFANQVEKSLIPFMKKNNIQSRVILLDDPDGNSWIPQVDENWSGAIPATIIYQDDKWEFYEKSFSEEELQTELNKFTNT